MSIHTRLTSMFGLDAPLVLAPMGGVAGGALAAAVSNAGGLGLLGAGYGDAAWLAHELGVVREATVRAWGVGFITWYLDAALLEQALACGPSAVMLSFGDPLPWSATIKSAGCRLICQVQDLAGARAAHDAGADLIVAQGSEAGGHGAARATLPLVPAVVDLVHPVPVLAAGGIADGRGLAAALMLGAEGALIGTCFHASREALGGDARKQRLVAASGDDTLRTRVFDVVRGYDWPEPFTGRALVNDFVRRWHGREEALVSALGSERERFAKAQAADELDTGIVWAGEGVDAVTAVRDAGEIVRAIAAQAEAALRAAPRWLGDARGDSKYNDGLEH